MIHPAKATSPAAAYDLWAAAYDEQTDNPIIYLDELVFNEMFAKVSIEGKIVVDIGCGTGRHWKKIIDKKPMGLIGYDVSGEMLKMLQKKYPEAKTYQANDNSLKELENESCDIIISTLVIGYIENLDEAFTEWNRILKKGGEIIITDFHPEALKRGGNRSFKQDDRILIIRNYVHLLTEIKTLSKRMNWKPINLVERNVDKSIRHFYEKSGSSDVYDKSVNTPILYGYYLKKNG